MDPAHRDGGIGAQVLDHIHRTAASFGVAALRLEVDRANPRVSAFYRRRGFEPHDRDQMTHWLQSVFGSFSEGVLPIEDYLGAEIMTRIERVLGGRKPMVIGAVAGRYHYAADVVLGAVTAAVAWLAGIGLEGFGR